MFQNLDLNPKATELSQFLVLSSGIPYLCLLDFPLHFLHLNLLLKLIFFLRHMCNLILIIKLILLFFSLKHCFKLHDVSGLNSIIFVLLSFHILLLVFKLYCTMDVLFGMLCSTLVSIYVVLKGYINKLDLTLLDISLIVHHFFFNLP